MKIYKHPKSTTWPSILKRPTSDLSELEPKVAAILNAVKEKGDDAIRHYTELFDKVSVRQSEVTAAEFKAANEQVEPSLQQAIQAAKQNIERFHAAQHQAILSVETMPGVRCWRKSVPIQKVGLYIPGGTAPLFSTVLMLAIPAKLAGCQEIILCTPPQKNGLVNPVVLYAAQLVGITKVFKIGGVQAIGAMAYGTASVPKVYKIFGPGNQYVTVAKQLINKEGIAIDMPAGPSEVLVVADHTANPAFVAADLLSQAEHGTDSQVVLVTFDDDLVQRVQQAIEIQLTNLPRKTIAKAALENSCAVVVENRQIALGLINDYAPEHLIIALENAMDFANQIINAGSVFLGNYTPESIGDYASGTNHTLPTNGFAKAYSGVSLDAFVKKITYQEITPAGLQRIGPIVEKMAVAEQLVAHKEAVSIRLKSLNL